MTKPNLRLAGEPPARTPERQLLANALIAQAHAAEAIEANETRYAELREQSWAAERTLEAAKAAVANAKNEAADALASGATPPDRETLFRVRGAETQAAEQFDILREAALRAEKAAPRLAMALRNADDAVEAALRAVVGPTAAAMVADYEARELQLLATRKLLQFLFSYIPRKPGQRDWQNHPSDASIPDLREPWRAALEALREDPDAELPFYEHDQGPKP